MLSSAFPPTRGDGERSVTPARAAAKETRSNAVWVEIGRNMNEISIPQDELRRRCGGAYVLVFL